MRRRPQGQTRTPFTLHTWAHWMRDRGWTESREERRQRLQRRAGIEAFRRRVQP
jgi:hypothetical protein